MNESTRDDDTIDTIGRETIHVPRDDDDDDDDDSIRDATRPRRFPLLARTLDENAPTNAPTNDDDDDGDDRDHGGGVVRHDRARVAV